MKRIYLDTNIFSKMREGKDQMYSQLLEKLHTFKDRYLYFYSFAHLLDLTRDKTETKFDVLKFMEELVEDRFLSLENDKPLASISSIFPLQAFNNIPTNQDGNFDMAEALQQSFDNDTVQDSDTIIHLGLSKKLQNASSKTKAILSQFFTDLKDEYSVGELELIRQKVVKDLLNESKGTYKEFRRFSIQELDLKNKYEIDINDVDFSENLEDTPLKKSFVQFVTDSFLLTPTKDRREYSFFITAYNSLNILGIDKEKNKNVKLYSILYDGFHAYFGAHCDYFVTDDKGLYHKAKVLYKLFGIKTEVLTAQELEKRSNNIFEGIDTDKESYFKVLKYSLKNPISVQQKYTFNDATTHKIYELSSSLINYFNYARYIDSIHVNFYTFYKEPQNLSRFTLVEEVIIIVNKLVKIFGVDLDGFSYFDTELERSQLLDGTWEGREWSIGTLKLILMYECQTQKLVLFFHAPKHFFSDIYF